VDGERATHADRGAQLEPATVGLDEPAGEGQAETGALDLAAADRLALL
jgi:hypothetical protein